jgi:SM-20-related protein
MPSQPVFDGIHGRDLGDDDVIALGDRGWMVKDGFLDAELVAGARREAERLPGLRAAGVSRDAVVDGRVRGDRIAWIVASDDTPALSAAAARFEAIRIALNEGAYLGLRRFELQLACYPGDGARYDRHLDAFAGSKQPGASTRRATAIVYLNPGWGAEDGGVLRLHVPGGPVAVEPIAGRLVVFLSERIEHEVLPCFAPRWALTAWYHGSS